MKLGPVLLCLALVPQAANAVADFQTVFERGLRDLAAGRLAAAQSAFREARRIQPDNPAVYYQLGEVYAVLGEPVGAISHFRRAIALEPAEPSFYVRLSMFQTRLQQYHDAKQTLETLLRLQPEFAEAHLLMGRVSEEQGDYPSAERCLHRYLELQPHDPRGLAELGAALLAQEKDAEAEPLLLRAVRANPTLGSAHYNLGLAYSRQAEHRKAKEHLETAARLLGNADAYFHLGAVLARLGEEAPAETAFRKALALSSSHLEVLHALSTLLQRQDRMQEAESLVAEYQRLSARATKARRRNRRLSTLHMEAQNLLVLNRAEEAQVKLEAILELDPDNDLADYRLGQIEFLRHHYARSLQRARQAIGLKGFEPSYRLLEATCLERLDRSQEAVAAYQVVLDLADYAEARAGLARLALVRGDSQEALRHLRKAVELEPRNPDFHFALAEALKGAGNLVESEEQRAQAEALRKTDKP